MIIYPTRCRIIDIAGQEIFPEMFPGTKVIAKTLIESKPHIGKEGLAEKIDEWNVRITLDDGNIIWGYECWWKPIKS